ncbi:MAG: BMP family ABC transporter substrate-binding protein, partial [Anaerolineae bacterium]
IASSLITSAQKNMDVAAGKAVEDFAAGNLKGGIVTGTVANGGIGLAPYHDWDGQISAECKAAVDSAAAGLSDGSISTGYTP